MIPRTLGDIARKSAHYFPVISITGPRQSGKTTLAREVFADYTYLNLEALDTRSWAEEDPRRFLTENLDTGMIIDEAQRVPKLFSYIQILVDELKDTGKLILTGSQNFLLLQSISQSLAGRVMVLHLLPFTLQEMPDLRNREIDEVMLYGMYPPVHDRRIEPFLFYPAYTQTYIERDVRLIRNIGDLSAFGRFLRLCAGRIGSLLNLSSLAVEAGIDHKTAGSWLSILEASFITFRLEPYHRSFNKRIVKQPKLYFYDTGLACSLLGITRSRDLALHHLRGNLFENHVVSEYRKMRLHTGRQPSMYFWRNNTGIEVDLVLEDADDLYAVEIKSGSTMKDDYLGGLTRFSSYSGTPPERSFVVYGGETSHTRTHGRVLGWREMTSLPGLENDG
jgi:uncharacterized protein